MGSEAGKKWGAVGRSDLYQFDPDTLTVVTDKRHPLYDPRVEWPLDEDMVLSIVERGVIEAIVVRRNGFTADNVPIVEVIDGRRRVLHAREANRRKRLDGKPPVRVPGTTRVSDDKGDFVDMLITNEHRRQDDPMMRARKIKQLLAIGYNEADAAHVFCLTLATVRSSLRLLECSADVQKAVEERRLPVSLASKMSALPREEQDKELAHLVASGTIGSAKAKTHVEKTKGNRGRERATSLRARSHKEITEALAALDVCRRAVDERHETIVFDDVRSVLLWALRRESEITRKHGAYWSFVFEPRDD